MSGHVRGRRAIALVAALVAATLAFVAWARAEHGQGEAVAVAEAFLARLQQDDFEGAFALTAGGGAVGRSPSELREVAGRQSCRSGRRVWTAPPQTNGNRLRRRLSGREVEMDEVRVEFEGPCLLGVQLRHRPGAGWRVVRFASHAG
ncbi:MAG: hypothetical protein ABW067_08845 [Rhizobacter sp.]